METICGFIVVREPEFALADRFKLKLQVGDKMYRGICRLPWEDLDESYYNKVLPSSHLPVWQELKRGDVDFSGVRLLKDYQKANEVLQLSRARSEMIAIWSPELDELKGSARSTVPLEFLGLDCFSLGEWSALLYGPYARPEHFNWAVARLNESGLLTSDDDCNEVFRTYIELSKKQIVEPLMDEAKHTNLRIFRVHTN